MVSCMVHVYHMPSASVVTGTVPFWYHGYHSAYTLCLLWVKISIHVYTVEPGN